MNIEYILKGFKSHIEKKFLSCEHKIYIRKGFKFHIKKYNFFLGNIEYIY